MKNLEYKEPEPADLGSFELNKKGRIMRNPEVTGRNFLKNEREIKDSKERLEARRVLLESWWRDLKMSEIFDSEEVSMIFQSPDNFIAGLIKFFNEDLTPQQRDFYLSKVERNIQTKLVALKERHERTIDLRLDYVNSPEQALDKALDKELKSRLEMLIEMINIYINNGQCVLNFVEEEKTKSLN